MEHYWCLRWLEQEQVTEADGTVLRENLVRIDGLPLVAARCLAAGARAGQRACAWRSGRPTCIERSVACALARDDARAEVRSVKA